jgi:hypothetical protein
MSWMVFESLSMFFSGFPDQFVVGMVWGICMALYEDTMLDQIRRGE